MRFKNKGWMSLMGIDRYLTIAFPFKIWKILNAAEEQGYGIFKRRTGVFQHHKYYCIANGETVLCGFRTKWDAISFLKTIIKT